MSNHPDFDGRPPSAWAHRPAAVAPAASKPNPSHYIGVALDLAAAVDEDIKALHPGDKVIALDGKVHRLNNVTHDTDVATGEITRAAGYSGTAGRWLDLLTGRLR